MFILIFFNVFWSRVGYSQDENRPKDIRREIISIFKKLVQLNEDFKSSVDSGVGKSGDLIMIYEEKLKDMRRAFSIQNWKQ